MIGEEWGKTFDGFPFSYQFMDQNFDVLYADENKFSNTIQVFSVLAIFIGAVGVACWLIVQ